MAKILSDRKITVEIGSPGEQGIKFDESLRIAGTVDKTIGREANTIELKLYNLRAESRAQIQAGMKVYISAGYPETVELIGSGDISSVSVREPSQRDGPDRIVELEAGDGRRAMKQNIQTAIAPGATPEQIVGKLKGAMKDLDLSEGFSASIRKLGDSVTGVSLSGPVDEELDAFFAGTPYTWSIQDGEIQIVTDDNDGATGSPAVLLSPGSGLVGSHERVEGGSKFVSLMNGRIVPGGLIQLETPAESGLFVAGRVRHNFDTHGEPWYSEIEAKDYG